MYHPQNYRQPYKSCKDRIIDKIKRCLAGEEGVELTQSEAELLDGKLSHLKKEYGIETYDAA